ncbi:hypothetical protein [Flagellimonas zhangzhouensis]|uniref:Uncharacterized protein n=1 Tax=Flagellimonas zhangzhouensis TaxID=1073328 RepID=A0A1H2SU14_9FLAO|nr:hypothetical protein [Allomuricauda zhangzhouensis]SDQ79446.1 hypothetical protein SAMN05216294_2629 [Allomuricauda zhangzhouensis]SDW35141.1 hypothetical protein SAMN04487892_1270 [Allomuricauda zhangzhouensis]
MAPKSHVLVVAALIFAANATYSQCDNFYSKVTYALSHSKKAMSATNFEHQMYYAERALTALEKSEPFMEDCGCDKAKNKRLDAMETLDKAIEPTDWEAGRFFTKKALGEINELITIVDQCTLGVSSPGPNEDMDVVSIDENSEIIEEETTTTSNNSMEAEMIKVFEKHADDKLISAENAIIQLVELSKSIGTVPAGTQDPNSLASHQKAYLEKAKKLLEDGIKNLEREE